jgi:hypothetical protein
LISGATARAGQREYTIEEALYDIEKGAATEKKNVQ